jgi:hypothetical protein
MQSELRYSPYTRYQVDHGLQELGMWRRAATTYWQRWHSRVLASSGYQTHRLRYLNRGEIPC